ncbi:MAG: sugar-binding protein [Candidatus Sericytochromatia bacterium]
MSTIKQRRPAPPRPLGRPPRATGKRPMRPALVVACAAAIGLLGLAVAVGLHLTRPTPQLLEPPALTPALKARLLAALHPGYPGSRPALGGETAAEGSIESVGAADVDGDGQAEWAVAYAWLGAPAPAGGRQVRPGLAVLRSDTLEKLYDAPASGGWNGAADPAFPDVDDFSNRVEAVDLGEGVLGFVQRYRLESRLGGRQSHGRARVLLSGSGGWGVAWEGETEARLESGPVDEVAEGGEVTIEDLDGDGRREVLLGDSRYLRKLDAAGRGPHFTADLDARQVFRRVGDRFEPYGLARSGEPSFRQRPAPPLLAVRTSLPVRIDANFAEWQAQELATISGLTLASPDLLMFKRRDRSGMDDISGEVRLMWDPAHLYLHATVMDDRVVPGAAGRELYRGDHLAVWLDHDHDGDFGRIARSQDDWQIGFSPGRPAQAHAWVPKPGRHGLQVASRPHVDPYSGGVYGYELEMAIPWADLGGLPPGLAPSEAPAAPVPLTGEPRRYELALQGVVGLGLVLSDSDAQPQELAYVSNGGFRWADPTSFNTLLLVEPRSR